MVGKVPYICGPLTDFPTDVNPHEAKEFYSRLGDIFLAIIGARAFVPHEYFDPIQFAHFTDIEVYLAESGQITQRTSLLVVAHVAPTTGGGCEIALAADLKIPIVWLCPRSKKISRYPLGLTKDKRTFQDLLRYDNFDHAVEVLRKWAEVFFGQQSSLS